MTCGIATSRALLLAVALGTLTLAAPAAADGGGLRGKVTLFSKAFFGGTREDSDRSGVVVYVTGFQRQAPAAVATLEQRNRQFRPRVLPVVAGQKVEFPNYDPIYHNVFSVSPIQPFDLGQHTSAEPAAMQTFTTPGLVPVYCNIHPDMIAYVIVLENDAFAVTAEDGTFSIANLPPGRHQVHAWAPAAQRVTQDIEVRAGEVADVSLTLQRTEKIAPHKRKDGGEYPLPGESPY